MCKAGWVLFVCGFFGAGVLMLLLAFFPNILRNPKYKAIKGTVRIFTESFILPLLGFLTVALFMCDLGLNVVQKLSLGGFAALIALYLSACLPDVVVFDAVMKRGDAKKSDVELKNLVREIFKIIPSYYDEAAAQEIETLIKGYAARRT